MNVEKFINQGMAAQTAVNKVIGGPLPLFVRGSASRAPVQAIVMVSAIVDFIQFRSTKRDTRSLRAEIMDVVKKIWPSADCYIGGTHFRILLDGRSDGESVYVDTEGGAS